MTTVSCHVQQRPSLHRNALPVHPGPPTPPSCPLAQHPPPALIPNLFHTFVCWSLQPVPESRALHLYINGLQWASFPRGHVIPGGSATQL